MTNLISLPPGQVVLPEVPAVENQESADAEERRQNWLRRGREADSRRDRRLQQVVFLVALVLVLWVLATLRWGP